MDRLGHGIEGLDARAAAGILVERLKNAGDLGDKRDALDALLELSDEHPAQVGEAGMPIFADILQAGVADGSMTQAIMGIMLNLVKGQDGPGAGASIASFLSGAQNVQNLLDLLENQDKLTAISAVQVLQALQNSAPAALEDRILECPAGLQVLVEVLRDPREEVRNEVVLLLRQLTSSNLEVKKFVAFQEGFEGLFAIMFAEGMLEGGSMIVKDCIDVCINIVTSSPLTKALFCQSKCLTHFHELIDVRTARGQSAPEASNGNDNPEECELPRADESRFDGISPTQEEIVCTALELLLVLLAGDGDEAGKKRADRQSLVAGTEGGLLAEMVAHVAYSRAETFSRSPSACRGKAMRAIGALVDGHATNQSDLGELLIQDIGLESVALATRVMEAALGEGDDDGHLNTTHHWVLTCFFQGNGLMCTQLVSHVIAPPPPPLTAEDLEAWAPPPATGKVLIEGMAAAAKRLFDGNVIATERPLGAEELSAAVAAGQIIGRGCKILAMVFAHGGDLTKEIALRVPTASTPDAHNTTLLHTLMRWLELAASSPGSLPASAQIVSSRALQRVAANVAIWILQLLCRWLYDCSTAARDLLSNPANLFVLDVAAGRSSVGGVEGISGDDGRHETGASDVQRTVAQGLACLTMGLLLVHAEGASTPSTKGSNDGEWTRGLLMKMIQNRIGMTSFMAAMEATKKAFTDADTARRRKRRRDDAHGRTRGDAGNSQDLELDLTFLSDLSKSSEAVRRTVISTFAQSYGDGGGSGGANIEEHAAHDGNSGQGLVAIVQGQEGEIARLRLELSSALDRVPTDGGMSALEEGLKKQVQHLQLAAATTADVIEDLELKLSEAMANEEAEKQRRETLTSELQGLSITVSSLERQLLDREAVCDGLRRQLDAGTDRSRREDDLGIQLEEARSRALRAEEVLEQAQRQSMADAAAAEAAEEAARNAKKEAEAAWSARVGELEAALAKFTTGAGGGLEASTFCTTAAESEPTEPRTGAFQQSQAPRHMERQDMEMRAQALQLPLVEKTDDAGAFHGEGVILRATPEALQELQEKKGEPESRADADAQAKGFATRLRSLEEQNGRLLQDVEQVEALRARCAVLEETMASADADAEVRLRKDMQRDRQLRLGSERSLSEIQSQLEQKNAVLAEKDAAMSDLKTRLDEVQVFLAGSEEEREAAQVREVATSSKLQDMQLAVEAAEERLKQATADLEDRDSVIAAVEDARVAQEREAYRLREKLSGLGLSCSPIEDAKHEAACHPDGTPTHEGAEISIRAGSLEHEEQSELLAEHEDLLQLLAQQEVVKKKLLRALVDTGGQALARAVMKDAETDVADAYGAFVRYTDDEIGDDVNGQAQAGIAERRTVAV